MRARYPVPGGGAIPAPPECDGTLLSPRTQTKEAQAHWNVKGQQFHSLHELFDDLAGETAAYVDLIAERATALALTERFGALAATTCAAIDGAEELEDMDTADLFTEVSRGLDKSQWFLEAHLQA